MFDNQLATRNIIEIAIKIVILTALIVWSFQVIRPFLLPAAWGIILAVATEPFIARVARTLGNRRILTAILFVLVIIATIVIPAVLLVMSSIEVVQELIARMHNKTLVLPPPPPGVADWPLVGDTIHQVWQLFATNLTEALKQFAPQLRMISGKLLGSVGGGLISVFMGILSVCFAGVFLAKAEQGAAAARKVSTRIAGDRGIEFLELATATIRGVMQGVVGVALIQAFLAGLGMVVIDVPAAGLWAILVLVVAVCQLSPLIVLGPVAVYVFSISATTPAVLFLIWSLMIGTLDNILKPLLMTRGINIPMLVILVGALGGMIMSGIIGLFVGAVVLAIMYTLFITWLNENDGQLGADPE